MKKLLALTFVATSVLLPQVIRADTTGEVFPTAGVDVSEAPWSDNTWGTTDINIFADDGTAASVTAGTYDATDQTWVLKASGFDFSGIPVGSTINGVTIRINAWADSTLVSLDLCQLLNVSLAKVGTNNCSTATALDTTQTVVYTEGSASDLWGNSLTVTWVQDPDFGVAIGALASTNNSQVFVDYVTIEIDYTPPASAPTVTTNAETNVGVTSAVLNGEITATGGSNATVRGFAWGTNSTLSSGDTSTTTESGSFGTGTFSQWVINLLSNTTYYFRAYATNSTGTGYGSVIESFVTSTDTSVSRAIRLFEGFVLRLFSGRLVIYQR